METAIEVLKAGAFDFVSKPVDLPVLRKLVNTALKLQQSGGDATAKVITDEEASVSSTS